MQGNSWATTLASFCRSVYWFVPPLRHNQVNAQGIPLLADESTPVYLFEISGSSGLQTISYPGAWGNLDAVKSRVRRVFTISPCRLTRSSSVKNYNSIPSLHISSSPRRGGPSPNTFPGGFEAALSSTIWSRSPRHVDCLRRKIIG